MLSSIITFALGSTITTALLLSNYFSHQHSFLSQRSETDLEVFGEIKFQKSCVKRNKQLRSIEHHLQRYRDQDLENFIEVQKSILTHLVSDQCTHETIILNTVLYRVCLRTGHIICIETSNSNTTANTHYSERVCV